MSAEPKKPAKNFKERLTQEFESLFIQVVLTLSIIRWQVTHSITVKANRVILVKGKVIILHLVTDDEFIR